MRASLQFRRGLEKAMELTATTARQASIKAGYNEKQLDRFISGRHDILLTTLIDICEEGFGLTIETVLRMGKSK